MACLICGALNAQEKVFEFKEPDKYEAYVGIQEVQRTWLRCATCGHYTQTRNYPLEQLEFIYKRGYREEAFRGESIAQAYHKLCEIMGSQSENGERCRWFVTHSDCETVLDVGSGIGVFPARLNEFGYHAECVEANEISIDFIQNELQMVCYDQLPDHPFEAVSLVHLLEHIKDPDSLLQQVRPLTQRQLFVEVPDAREFAYLPQKHDEFNSCHVHFFTSQNLITLIERNRFEVTDVSRKQYPKRKLSRLLLMAVPC